MKTIPCLTLELLDEYIHQRLSPEEEEEIEAHLADCDPCREEFVLANSLLGDPELWASADTSEGPGILKTLDQKIQALFRRLESKLTDWCTGLIPPDWAFNPVRNSDAAAQSLPSFFLKRYFDDIIIEFYAEKTDECRLLLYLKPFRNQYPLQHVHITLSPEAGGRYRRTLRGENEAFKKQLPFGSYQLELKQNSHALVDYRFAINAHGFFEDAHPLS